ncbi:hypothetical protein GGR52DRAFT_82274 [Hypoxylon sp. FL1284]|nr:hypothetical protein GGR52DRAFT_82274 [Hypoxylon sp. FL1284]
MASSFSAAPDISPGNVQSNPQSDSNPYSPATPFPLSQLRPQPKTYSAIYEKVIAAKGLAGEGTDGFYDDSDVYKHAPAGWPSLAATHMFPNYDSHRAFRYPTHLILVALAQKIDCLANKLDEMNFEDEGDKGGEALRSLPFDRERFIERCVQGSAHPLTPTPGSSTGATGRSSSGALDRAAQRENLLTCIAILLKEYFTLLHMHKENLQMPGVSRRAHRAHFETARQREGLDDQACSFMRYIDDWICPRPDLIFQRFESLLYMNSTGLKKFLKHLCCLFCLDPSSSSSSSSASSSSDVLWGVRGFDWLYKALLGLSSLALLSAPVAILHLADGGLSRAAELGVVVGFSALFCGVLVAFEPSAARLLVGLAAFFAVLATFLSTSSTGTPCVAAAA